MGRYRESQVIEEQQRQAFGSPFDYIVDKNMQIHVIDNSLDPGNSVQPDVSSGWLARGRYDPSKQWCSVILSPVFETIPMARYQQMQYTISRLISRTFNTTQLRFFNSKLAAGWWTNLKIAQIVEEQPPKAFDSPFDYYEVGHRSYDGREKDTGEQMYTVDKSLKIHVVDAGLYLSHGNSFEPNVSDGWMARGRFDPKTQWCSVILSPAFKSMPLIRYHKMQDTISRLISKTFNTNKLRFFDSKLAAGWWIDLKIASFLD